MTEPTHDDLVERAERWLRNSAWRAETWGSGREYRQGCKCGVVLAEPSGGCTETPDAIGWFGQGRQSILIECKVSRADFMADAKKLFRRRPEYGVGNFRYFMVRAGLIAEDDLPDGWGLLEVRGRTVKIVRHSERFDSQRDNEMSLLWSECRKIQIVERGGKLEPTKAGLRIMSAITDELTTKEQEETP